MSSQQLLDRMRVEHPTYGRQSVREAVDEHAQRADGVLTRPHVGLFRLRQPTDRPGEGTRVARDWVLDALGALADRVGRPVTRREVERELAAMGVRYSERAVNKGLTDLVRDPSTGVTMTVNQRYRLAR
jgi:hypothetical protein